MTVCVMHVGLLIAKLQENLQDHRQALIEGNTQMAMQIERSECEREEVRPKVEELERYHSSLSIHV